MDVMLLLLLMVAFIGYQIWLVKHRLHKLRCKTCGGHLVREWLFICDDCLEWEEQKK